MNNEKENMLNNVVNNIILNDNCIKKNIDEYTWVSGSQTIVHPITIWIERGEIVIQLKHNKNVFNKCIKRIIENSNGTLIYGDFSKSDGSCPSTLHFFTNYSYLGQCFTKKEII